MRKICEFGINLDERIADGYYMVKSVKVLQYILDNPKLLEEKIGKIIDVEFDQTSGYMVHFVIEEYHFFKGLFSNRSEFNIKFSQIKKLGEDVILIDIS